MNRCGIELSYQNDLFSQLENETKNTFSDPVSLYLIFYILNYVKFYFLIKKIY